MQEIINFKEKRIILAHVFKVSNPWSGQSIAIMSWGVSTSMAWAHCGSWSRLTYIMSQGTKERRLKSHNSLQGHGLIDPRPSIKPQFLTVPLCPNSTTLIPSLSHMGLWGTFNTSIIAVKTSLISSSMQ